MIVASFLIKDLMVDWREGEAWFWDTLVDADIAQNAANWQWVAGSGADASPYFRIFNPVTQGQKFDAAGALCPALGSGMARLPDDLIHALDRLAARPASGRHRAGPDLSSPHRRPCPGPRPRPGRLRPCQERRMKIAVVGSGIAGLGAAWALEGPNGAVRSRRPAGWPRQHRNDRL